MVLNLMYITNKPVLAEIAEKAGVDWIFIDLEINGKVSRQGHLDTVISRHNINDISKVKKVLNKSKLLVRVNPIHEDSKVEINAAISGGADIIMLPYFKTVNEVKEFIKHINQRVKVCLLLETKEAIQELDGILKLEGIDMIHVGLNDLHLSYGMNFMFEPLANGMIDKIGKKVLSNGIEFGFGGIARCGQGILPAENIIVEHYRIGSSMVILSRSFCDVKDTDSIEDIQSLFTDGVRDIRNLEKKISTYRCDMFSKNNLIVKEKVDKIVKAVRGN